jgi:hypothetical protein
MLSPEQVPLRYRVMLACAVVVIVVIVLSLASCFLDAAPSREEDDPPLSKYEDHIIALDREALDKAYKDHIGLVFGVWMKAPTDPDSPRRAGAGARNARQGYAISIEKIENRERRLKESK